MGTLGTGIFREWGGGKSLYRASKGKERMKKRGEKKELQR